MTDELADLLAALADLETRVQDPQAVTDWLPALEGVLEHWRRIGRHTDADQLYALANALRYGDQPPDLATLRDLLRR
jgi:hypothetical protein